jgi:hypothetical protein
MNRCEPDAYVLGPDRDPPADPTEYDWENRSETVGCNRLFCPQCKEEVRMVPSPDPARRLYVCAHYQHSASEGCMTHEIHFTMFGDAEPVTRLPWTCGGHPSAELPVRFLGRTIEDRAELVAAIVGAPDVDAVLSLHNRTRNGSLGGIVPESLMGAMGSSSPPDRARLIDLLASTLFWERSTVGVVQEMLARLCAEALSGVTTSHQLYVLGIKDVEWLVAHIDELLAKSSSPAEVGRIVAWGARAIFNTTPAPEEAPRKVAALARKSGLDTETLVASMKDALGVRRVDYESRRVFDAIAAAR